MQLIIHPLRAEHHASAEALIVANAPQRIECTKSWPRKPTEPLGGGYVRRDFVALNPNNGQEVIGYASVWPQGEGRFRMDLIVAQDWRRNGVGGALFQELVENLIEQNASIVQARAFVDQTEPLAFLAHRNFAETNRMVHQRLDLTAASTADLSTLEKCLRLHGVTVVTLSQEQTRTPEDWLQKILDLLRATGPERVGDPYRVGADTEFWSKEGVAALWESSHPLSPDAVFLATHNGEYVGMSFLAKAVQQVVAQGETCVHVGWRRRGIATLLKLHAIRYAQRNGFGEISTRTASAGMRALNERLGFYQDGAEVRMVRSISSISH